jgi:hypothetical protein
MLLNSSRARPAQRGQAGTPMASDASGIAPKQTSPDEKTRLMENFTDLLLPGVGLLPSRNIAAAAARYSHGRPSIRCAAS